MFYFKTPCGDFVGGWGAAFPRNAPVCAIEGECVLAWDDFSIDEDYDQIMNSSETVCEYVDCLWDSLQVLLTQDQNPNESHYHHGEEMLQEGDCIVDLPPIVSEPGAEHNQSADYEGDLG